MTGVLALVGGAEWRPGCTFDSELLEASGTGEVLVLPTAAAYEHPERAVAQAQSHFAALGAEARGLMVLRREDANDAANAAAVAASRFVYLSGGSPMHLRSVLKDSAVWEALEAAWRSGAVLAASSAGAMVLGDPMVDPRGGAFTVGLGLLPRLAVVPHHDTWSSEKARRTIHLSPPGVVLLAIDEQTVARRGTGGAWTVSGAGTAVVFKEGRQADLDALDVLQAG